MNPREKAEHLVAQMHQSLSIFDSQLLKFVAAQECALIAVDELIESHLLLTTTHESAPSVRCKRYWLKVKQEIENIGGDK